MSFIEEKTGASPAREACCKRRLSKFLGAALLTTAALYCCGNKIRNGVEDVLLLPFAPQPKDYCKQVDAFDASNWTSVYDAKGYEAKAAEWLGGAVRIPYVLSCIPAIAQHLSI